MIRLHRLLWLPLSLVLISPACSSNNPTTSLIEMSVDERFVGQRVEQVLVVGGLARGVAAARIPVVVGRGVEILWPCPPPDSPCASS